MYFGFAIKVQFEHCRLVCL